MREKKKEAYLGPKGRVWRRLGPFWSLQPSPLHRAQTTQPASFGPVHVVVVVLFVTCLCRQRGSSSDGSGICGDGGDVTWWSQWWRGRVGRWCSRWWSWWHGMGRCLHDCQGVNRKKRITVKWMIENTYLRLGAVVVHNGGGEVGENKFKRSSSTQVGQLTVWTWSVLRLQQTYKQPLFTTFIRACPSTYF